MKTSERSVGMNGFGRFGLNLLWWWFNDRDAPYEIEYIHDEVLTGAKILEIIKTDPFVTGFQKGKVSLQGDILSLQTPDGRTKNIVLTDGLPESASWLGKPDLFFECSGRRSVNAKQVQPFLVDNTKVVIISATAYEADATLIMGFNEQDFDPKKHRIISYGSCTVNPGVVLASFFQKEFGVKECTVNVVHNVQRHRLDAGQGQTMQRKVCTLEVMGPRLLPFLAKNNFRVNYTVVPWPGVSMIDFAFRLAKMTTLKTVMAKLKKATAEGGSLEGLISVVPTDNGPDAHIGSPYSAVIIEDAARLLVFGADTLHLFCYFYNEGSGIRMHELASHIARKLK